MQKLILLSAQHAIYFETETVTKELLKKTARQYNIVPGKSILEAASSELLTVPKRKAQQTVQNGLQGKGRPKVEREADDILQIYTECQNKGWSVAKTLIQRGYLFDKARTAAKLNLNSYQMDVLTQGLGIKRFWGPPLSKSTEPRSGITIPVSLQKKIRIRIHELGFYSFEEYLKYAVDYESKHNPDGCF